MHRIIQIILEPSPLILSGVVFPWFTTTQRADF